MTRKAIAVISKEGQRILELHLLADEDPGIELDNEGSVQRVITLADDEAIERAQSGFFGVRIETGELFELPFRALLLDDEDVLIAVDDLQSSDDLLERHVDLRPHGGDCDNAPGLYRWDREQSQLVPLKRTAQRSKPAGVSLEAAFAQLLELNPQIKQGDRTMLWLAGYRETLDAQKKGRKA